MSTIEELQKWYYSTCNGEWGHRYGVQIETLDNPGWHVKIELTGTVLEDNVFPEVEYGIGSSSEPEGLDWIACKVEENVFHGYGGPERLEEILQRFLEWARCL